MRTDRRHSHMLLVSMATLLLSGCATFSSDGGMQSVADLTQKRTGQTVQRTADDAQQAKTDQLVRELLAEPLSADDAVRIALLNNRGLQASLAELGIAEADLVQAGRLRNPGISFGRMSNSSGAVEIERSVMFDLAGLLTMPIRTGIEQNRFEQTRLQAASSALTVAAETRRAYFNAISARQSTQFMERAHQAAEAGAELAQRMQKVGNWNRIDAAREQMFYADASAALARSRHEETVARERLIRLLGLWQSDTTLQLPDRLPDLPAQPANGKAMEQEAMTQRLDIQIARRASESTAKSLGLTRATRFINVLEASYRNKSKTGEPRNNGYEISLELPVFDWGTARTNRAEAIYMQSLHHTADTAIRARSEVREAYSAYRTAYDLSRHYRDEVVPLRKKVSEEVLLRYNGMLASVFDLLSDARLQIDAVNTAIKAQRDFWIAETDMQAAINGGIVSGMEAIATEVSASPSARQEH